MEASRPIAESAEQDLELIRQLMQTARETTPRNSQHLVLWGCVLGLAEGIGGAAARGFVPLSQGTIWLVAIAIGWLASTRLTRRERQKAPAYSLLNRVLWAIWVGAGIGLTLIGFLGAGTGAISPDVAPGVMAMVLGIAFFASSYFPHHESSRWLAVVWWTIGSALLVWPSPVNDLVMAGALLSFVALPGLLLRGYTVRSESIRLLA